MLELLARLFRVLWRQDLGGTGGNAVILDFPAAQQPIRGEDGAKALPAPVDFIRRAGHAALHPGSTAPSTRHLSAQLQSVSRLNGPSNRPRRGAAAGTVHKPKPVAVPAPLKRTPSVKPGMVIGRIARTSGRDRAEIVDLAEVRAEARRAKLVEAVDREIVALFH